MEVVAQKSGRDVTVLAGPWQFQLDQDDLGESEGWYSEEFDRSRWGEVNVPGAWDAYDQALWAYEGIGWYATEIPAGLVRNGRWQRLHFGRVNCHAKVWLNGQLLGEHIGGYLPFEFTATPFLRATGPNSLIMLVDNTPRPEWLPGSKTIEWMQYGGILQPVRVLTSAAVCISDLSVAAAPQGTGASVACQVEITNSSPADWRGSVTIRLPSPVSVTGSAAVECAAGGQASVSIEVDMPLADQWSPETPVLYDVSASLQVEGATLDEVGDRFGVRSIQVRGREILLNGSSLQIRGVNRYDEYARLGPTAPEEVVRQDLLRIKQSGVNLIRVHYPQDPATLNLMDEVGLLLMEEIPLNWWNASWYRPTDTQHDDEIIAAAQKALEDMIRRDKNHPCIVIWSMANECGTDTEVGIAAMRRLMRRTRELDATRLVTFVAAGDAQAHQAFDEADFVAVNLYHGLFHGDLAQHIADMDARVRQPTEEQLRRVTGYVGDKPVAVTEFGTHGIHGLRGDARFSEDYQAAYIEAVWQAIAHVPGVVGGVLWCWADYFHRRDFFGSGKGQMLQSPYGPYGVVTVDRQPKESLRALARMYGALPRA
jgi:beta-galactosidase/beta-glucuronidase